MSVHFCVSASIFEGYSHSVKVSGKIRKCSSPVAGLPSPSLKTFCGCLHVLEICFFTLEEAKSFASSLKEKYSRPPVRPYRKQPELF